jgi:uncharacterized repeat protein (TIGR03803 family)
MKGFAAVLSLSVLYLAGCGMGVVAGSSSPVATATGAITVQGVVHGGQQPVTQSTVTLWAVGSTGNGSAPTQLSTTATNSSGGFTLPSYTCSPTSELVYITATGGSPGQGNPANTAILLVAALGPCSGLKSTTNVVINEVTTVASVYALLPYMDFATGHIGYPSASPAGITSAFAAVNNLVNVNNGNTLLYVLAANSLAPQAEIDTLGNLLATCVNSTGSTASGQPCALLFAATPGTPPVNTEQVVYDIANNPTSDVTGLFSLAPTNGPFQPTLTGAPGNWNVQLTPVPPVNVVTSNLLSGTVGTSYSQQLTASGGSGSGYTWTVSSGTGLSAPGLSLSSGGGVSGIPLGVQTATPVTVLVTDSGGNTGTATLTLTVGPPATTAYIPLGSFTGLGGEQISSMVQGLDGNFYATASIGGNGSYGGIIKITPTGTITEIYHFCQLTNCADGTNPGEDGYAPDNPASLVMGPDGNFYGTTSYGGNSPYAGGSGDSTCGPGSSISACGTVFKITPSGQLTTLHQFCSLSNCLDGGLPIAGLVPGSDGNFYGTTTVGGTGQNSKHINEGDGGTIFKITQTGQLTTLYNFCSSQTYNGGCNDGDYPTEPLVQGSDGNFYGTTLLSATGAGELFQLTPAGKLTILYAFPGLATASVTLNGANPQGKLVEGSDGYFYGTQSGVNGAIPAGCTGTNAAYYWECGSIFKMSTTGVLTNPYYFGTNPANGLGSLAGLALGSDGNFYGTSEYGGNFTSPCTDSGGCGALWKMSYGGTVTPLYALCSQANCADGDAPETTLLQSGNGNFVGATVSGGGVGGGEFFELAPATAPAAPVQLSLSAGTVTHSSPVTVSWQVLNAFSTTMQVCNAFATTGGTTTPLGNQPGTLSSGIYAGSFSYTPAAAGSYSLALNCGGTETGFATLTAQ